VENNIAYYRNQAGLTQKQLAEKFNISQGIIASIERGTKSPSIRSLKMMSEFFGVSIDELLKNELAQK